MLKPFFERMLVARKNIDKTPGGLLFIPRGSQEARVDIGRVVRIGDECDAVNEGDVVFFGKYAWKTVDPAEFALYGLKIDEVGENEELIIMNQEDLLGKWVEETEVA